MERTYQASALHGGAAEMGAHMGAMGIQGAEGTGRGTEDHQLPSREGKAPDFSRG